MVERTILIGRASAKRAFAPPSELAACALAAAAPRTAGVAAPQSTSGPMTVRSPPPSNQEGFFWKTKTLEEMSSAEWESLCDGCARCCLEKLEDEDTGKIYFTHISCKLLDAGLCACKDYPNRSEKVPDCVRLTPENVRTINWVTEVCDIYCGQPLISANHNTVHKAGVSLRGRVQGTEDEIATADLEDHIVR